MTFKKKYAFFLLTLVFFSTYFYGCQHSGGSSNVSISKVDITPPTSSVALGTSQQFKASAVYLDGSNIDITDKVTWHSQNKNVAIIDAQGKAVSVSVGSTGITAGLGGMTSAAATLSVTAAELLFLEVYPTNPSIALGTKQPFTATGIYTDGPKGLTADVAWGSSDKEVSKFGDDNATKNVARGISPGVTTVSASYETFAAETALTVTAATLASIAVTPTNPSIALGTAQRFTATGTYTDTTTQDITASVTWHSGVQAVALISNDAGSEGHATSHATGSTGITASLDGITSDVSTLSVTEATLESITVTPTNPTVPLGVDLDFTATGTYSDGTKQNITTDVTWISADSNVSTISNTVGKKGLAETHSTGSTDITAIRGGVSSPASTLNVTAATLMSIAVTPADPTTPLGIDMAFTATGAYSDGSTQEITAQCTWASSDKNVSAISNAENREGIATPVAIGSTGITATLGGVSSPVSTLTVTEAILQSVTVTPDDPSTPLGIAVAFSATGILSDGSAQEITSDVTWASSDVNVSTISNAGGSKGVATPVAMGSTDITATQGDISSPASTLEVTQAVLGSIAVSPGSASTPLGVAVSFTATGTYSDGSEQSITTQATWISSDTDVAAISSAEGSEGVATPVAMGTADVTATLEGITSPASSLEVTAPELVRINITPASKSIPLGLHQQFTAEGIYTDGSRDDITDEVTWHSSNESVATIGNTGGSEGNAASVAIGTTDIHASLDGITSSVSTLEVTEPELVLITLEPSDAAVLLKTFSLQYAATGVYTNGSMDITTQAAWSSSNTGVAIFSQAEGYEGLAILISKGKTAVSATLDGITGTTPLEVK